MNTIKRLRALLDLAENGMELAAQLGPCNSVEHQRGYCFHGDSVFGLPCPVADVKASIDALKREEAT